MTDMPYEITTIMKTIYSISSWALHFPIPPLYIPAVDRSSTPSLRKGEKHQNLVCAAGYAAAHTKFWLNLPSPETGAGVGG